ncbi:hypothetical protein ABLE68_02660 [Nocardioides sp. CN2-186]
MGDQSRSVTIVKAVATVLVVTVVIAGALGGATYLAARVLVSMMPG